MRKTSIIVPCSNEAGRLNVGEFLDWACRKPDLHFLFVDDGSTDGTGEILDRLSRTCTEQIRRITMERNRGKAEAVRRGFLESFESGFDVIGYWDADLATPLETIPRFCELLEDGGVDGVLGSRVMLLGRHIRRNPFRHYLGRVYATCASLVIGLPVYDTQCGAKISRNTERLRQVFRAPFRVTGPSTSRSWPGSSSWRESLADRLHRTGLSSILSSDGKIFRGRSSGGGTFSVVPGRSWK